MFLSVEHLSIDFPLAIQRRGQMRAQAPGASPLGGTIHNARGRSFVRAIDDVCFELGKGDRLALVGHNGSGKSTLLRALAGIYHPTQGIVRSSGHVSGIFNMSLGFRHEASGYRNLVLKGMMAGRTRAQIEAAMPEIAEFTGLGPYLDMPLQTYSQGMAMRLAFAATTAFSNDILVMDEWIGAGDAGFQEKIIARMTDFLHASTIIVLASHSTGLLRRIANKAIWLEHGRIRKAGDVDVIDEYEASIAPQGPSAEIRKLVHSRSGMWWLPAAPGSLSIGHLLWNYADAPNDLQLFVEGPDGTRQTVRNSIERAGAWLAPDWVRPGLRFEIASRQQSDPLGQVSIPKTGKAQD
jgi:ABC-type polysaccharide/polyol phosphate transport system ATPase subunit